MQSRLVPFERYMLMKTSNKNLSLKSKKVLMRMYLIPKTRGDRYGIKVGKSPRTTQPRTHYDSRRNKLLANIRLSDEEWKRKLEEYRDGPTENQHFVVAQIQVLDCSEEEAVIQGFEGKTDHGRNFQSQGKEENWLIWFKGEDDKIRQT